MSFHFKSLLPKAVWVLIAVSILSSCKNKTDSDQTEEQTLKLAATPAFNADSAYAFIQKQVDFGPRVPNSSAHAKCGDYLVATLERLGLEVTEQNFTATTYDNKKLKARNIIGSFNPSASKRILLASHWDSRPFADQDSVHKEKPVPAANDGASGVGVLLEITRMLASTKDKPDIGIDIIFFDAEDWGNSEEAKDKFSGYCLGSQYWAANKHAPGYTAYFGILLDMVGAKNATFLKEGYSMEMAGGVVKTVWDIAAQLGYSNFFIDRRGSAITDDHLPVNEVAKIPMIDIIHTQADNIANTFFEDWHTTQDTMDNIDPETLKAVGQTLTQVLFQEAQPGAM
jgi:glutaminyl-peptide cyclotransferase